MTQYIPNGRPGLPPDTWKKWVLACGTGAFLGITAAAALAIAHRMLLGEPASNADRILYLFFMLLAGTLEGSILAYFQYRLIGKIFPEIAWKQWLAYTIAATLIAWMLGILPSLFLTGNGATDPTLQPSTLACYSMAALMGLLLGALFGYFQWLPLKGLRKEAMLWIPANALGWAVGMVFVFLGATWTEAITSWPFALLASALSGMAGGLSVGAIAGFFLLRIARSAPKGNG
jgi:hypothetical protein